MFFILFYINFNYIFMQSYTKDSNQTRLNSCNSSSNFPLFQKLGNSSSMNIFKFHTKDNQSQTFVNLEQKQQKYLKNQDDGEYEEQKAGEILFKNKNTQKQSNGSLDDDEENIKTEEQSQQGNRQKLKKKVGQKNKNNGQNNYYRQNPFKTNNNPFQKIKNRNYEISTNPFSNLIAASKKRNTNYNPFTDAKINPFVTSDRIRSSAAKDNPFSISSQNKNFSQNTNRKTNYFMPNTNLENNNQNIFNPLNSSQICNQKFYLLQARMNSLALENKQIRDRYEKLQNQVQQLKADKKDKQSLFEFCAAQLVNNTNKTRILQQKIQDIQNRMQTIFSALSIYESQRNKQRLTHKNKFNMDSNQELEAQNNYLSYCSQDNCDFDELSIQECQQIRYQKENHSKREDKKRKKENLDTNMNLVLKQLIKEVKQNHQKNLQLLNQSKSLSKEQTKMIQKNTRTIEMLVAQIQDKKGIQIKYQKIDNKEPNDQNLQLVESDLKIPKGLSLFKLQKVQKNLGEYAIEYELSDKGILNNFLKNLIIGNNYGKVIFLEEIPRNNFDNIFYQKSIQKFIVISEKKCHIPEYQWKLYQKQVIFYNYFEVTLIEKTQQKLKEYDLDFHPRKKRYDIKTNCLHLW